MARILRAIAFGLLVLSSLAVGQSGAATLVARYDFENAGNLGEDSSSYANNGTANAGVTQALGGMSGTYAGLFNPASSGNITITPALNGLSGPDFSYSAWVKVTSTANYSGIVSQDTGGCCQSRLLVDPGLHPFIDVYTHSDYTFPSTVPLDRWFYLTLTAEQSGGSMVAKAYVNGMQIAGNPQLYPVGNPALYHTYIGSGAGASDHFMRGLLDDVRIYEGALSAADVAALMPQWTADASDNWSTAGNWSGGVPNAVDAMANFFGAITAPRTVTVDAATTTVGTVNFNNANAYTIAGNALSMDVSSGTAGIVVGGGSHQISAPLTLNDATVVDVIPAASTLTLSGAITGGKGLTKNGAGTLTTNSSTWFFVGSAANEIGPVTVNAGTLNIQNPYLILGQNGAAQFTQTGGTVNFTGPNGTYLSNGAGVSQMTFTGGTFNQTAAGLFVGVRRDATLTVSGTAAVTFPSSIILGWGADGPGVTGTLNVNGGTLSQTTGSFVLGQSNGTGIANLNGGTLTVGALSGGTGTSRVNFNGGVLRARENTAALLQGLTAANVLAGGAKIDTQAYTVTVAQSLLDGGGGGGLTKLGTGTLILSGSHGYSGDTTISAGTLQAGSNNVLPSGAGKGNVAVAGKLDVAGFALGVNGLTGTGTVDNSTGNGVLTVGLNDTTSTYGGAITNSGGSLALVKTGTGTLTLTGGNSYTGGTTVSGGVLQGNAASLQGNIANNASLVFDQATNGDFFGSISGTGSVTKTNAGRLTLHGTNTYDGQTIVGQGTLRLGAGGLPSSGLAAWYDAGVGITTAGGIVTAWDDRTGQHDATRATVGGSPVGPTLAANQVNGEPAVQITGSSGTAAWLAVSGSFQAQQVYTVYRSPSATFSGYGSVFGTSSGSRSFIFESGQQQMHWNPYPLGTTKNGVPLSSPYVMSPINQYMLLGVDTYGPTENRTYMIGRQDSYSCNLDIAEVLVYNRILTSAEKNQLGAYLAQKYGISTPYVGEVSNAIPDNSVVAIAGGATLDLYGVSETIGALADYPSVGNGGMVTNGVSGAPVVLTLGATSGTNTFSGVIQDGLSPVSLAKTGGATQILAGANTYTGMTTVSDGTLLVNGSIAGAATVNGGTLGGSGSIGGLVTVNSPGILDPGGSPGVLTLEAGVTFNGGVFRVQLDGTTPGLGGYDQLFIPSTSDGDVVINPATQLDPSLGYATGPLDYLWIILNEGTGTTSGYFAGMEEGSSVGVGGAAFNIFYHANFATGSTTGGNDVLLTTAPEPSAIVALLGLAAMGLAGYLRRRRRLS